MPWVAEPVYKVRLPSASSRCYDKVAVGLRHETVNSMKKIAYLCIVGVILAGCHSEIASTTVEQGPAPELGGLSDDFDSSSALSAWKHVDVTEGWNADQLQTFKADAGWLTMIPYTSTWYMDYRGPLVYKEVTGDFIVTTKLQTTNRAGNDAPHSLFSLGGLMIRTPRTDNARTWQGGRENYVFLSLGCADQSGNYQFEVKTTSGGQSDLEKIPAAGGEAYLQIAKIGPNIVCLHKQHGEWMVHKRYQRPDMPDSLQVGMTVYTDYPSASKLSAQQHNGTVIKTGNPDLIAKFDYVHFRRPKVPKGMNVAAASDGEILRILGDNGI